jgi:hypothetical protein
LNSNSTIGRGGTVDASLRCILVLKAPGTDFPSWYVSLRAGKPECTGDHEADICSSGWSRSKALRKSCLNCSLDIRADRSPSSISRSVLLFVSSANTYVTGSSLLFHDLHCSIELSQENIYWCPNEEYTIVRLSAKVLLFEVISTGDLRYHVVTAFDKRQAVCS